jgi:hypothetical protein
LFAGQSSSYQALLALAAEDAAVFAEDEVSSSTALASFKPNDAFAPAVCLIRLQLLSRHRPRRAPSSGDVWVS